MGLNNFNWSALQDKPDYSGQADMFRNILEGFKMGDAPAEQAHMTKKRSQDETEWGLQNEGAKFGNIIKRYQMETAPEKYRQEVELRKAQTDKELAHALYYQKAGEHRGLSGGGSSKSPALSNLGKMMSERQNAAAQFGEDSPQVKTIDAYLSKLSHQKEAADTKLPGSYLSKQADAERANEQRNYFAKHIEMPYIGSGSNYKLRTDVMRYKSTKDLKEKEMLGDKLAKAANAMKMAPEYAAAQLNSQKIPATVGALKHQKAAIQQGWPDTIDLEINNLPAEVQEKANEYHSKSLEELKTIGDKVSEKYLSGKYKASKGNILEEELAVSPLKMLAEQRGMTEDKFKSAIKHTAKMKGISEDEVLQALTTEGS